MTTFGLLSSDAASRDLLFVVTKIEIVQTIAKRNASDEFRNAVGLLD